MATKTKKPSGLTIARNNYTFFCTWKIGDKDYADGQQFQYRINAGAWTNLGTSANIGKTATSAAFSINPALYYPTAGKGTISSVSFRVRGNRKTYKQKKKSIKPGWSDWTEKAFTIRAPLAPSASEALDEEADNKTTFSGSATSNEDDAYMFTRLEWQTALTTDSGSPNYGVTNVVNSTSWSTTQTEDTSTINDGHSHTRYVRVRAVGVGGASAWVTAKHVYAVPNKPTNIKASATLRSGGVDVLMTFNTANSGIRPIDSIKSEYLLITPEEGVTIPSGSSWTAGGTTVYKDGSDTVRIPVNSPLGVDNVIFARAATVHDRNENSGDAVVAAYGALSDPTAITVTMGSTNTVQVQATNNSSVPDSFLAVYYHDKSKSSTAYVAGIIEHGDTSVNITVPAWSDTNNISVGVQAIVGVAHASTKADSSTSYSITPFSGRQIMRSAIIWQKVIPRPANVLVEAGNRDGVARVSWSWNSSSVDGVEISWADHDDAWESTDEPEDYQVSILYSPVWNISGLETGRKWYFKLRFYMNDGNTTEYSPWTNMVSLDLTSAPQTPSLILSNEAVIEGETFDASWIYVTTDGTRQTYAEIALVTDSGGTLTYGDVIAKTTTSQRITIDPKELGWTVGQTKLLALRVVSSSGRSSEWSGYQPIHIVEPVTCEITSTSLVEETVDERTYMALKDMPMTVTVSGAGNTNITSLVIERADSYHLDRPDEGHYDGYKGEAVYAHSQTGDAQITINLEALIGRLDDGASYKIVATVNDQYGQKATATQNFEVHWTHQATVPYGTGYIDPEYNVGIIIPIAPPEASSTDVCDIYRLTADQPQLIYPGATFGELYVDPYPTIGESGGYRIVLKTANDDYITPDNQFAWVDTEGSLDYKGSIIDFDDNQVRVHRNFDVSHDWGKDFTETQYLGGSVQGDWNPAISRTATVSGVAITLLDGDDINAMRDLATYPGICNLRTQDGSNFKCDVQVSESRSHDKGGYVANFTLKITRVDPQAYDGMTLFEWLSGMDGYEVVLNNLEEMAEEMEFPENYALDLDNSNHLIMTTNPAGYDSITYSIVNGELHVEGSEVGVKYTITYNLATNLSSTNQSTKVRENYPYTTTIYSTHQNYYLDTLTVTMGGEPVSGEWSEGTIEIPIVTGNIVINATTAYYAPVVTEVNDLTITSGGTGTLRVKLQAQPTQSQTVNLYSDTLTLSVASLTFTTANWDTYQSVTVTVPNVDVTTYGYINMTNSDPMMTESTVMVTVKALSYEDLVDTTIPSGAVTVTSADFNSATVRYNCLYLNKYIGTDSNIFIPAEMNGKPTVITAYSFENNTTVQYVTFADGVLVRGVTDASGGNATSLFSGCTNLVGVSNFPVNVVGLRESFSGCSHLKFVDNLDSLINITDDYYSFKNCTSLDYVQDLSAWTGVGLNRTFSGCSSLKKVFGLPQPSSPATFNYSFMSTAVTKVTFPANTSNLNYALNSCSTVTEVEILADGLAENVLTSVVGSPSQNVTIYANANSTTFASLNSIYASSSKVTISAFGGETLPYIVVWGDSTSSPGRTWIEWPKRLQTKIGTSQYLVKNEAVSGEYTTSTSARQGGNTLTVDAFTIPSDTTIVDIMLHSADGYTFSNRPIFSAGGSYNPCVINGVSGIITHPNGATNNKFHRLTKGSVVSVNDDTVVTSETDTKFNKAGNIMIISMGHNAGWDNGPAELVGQMQAMVNHFLSLGGTDYIVSGMWSGSFISDPTWWEDTEEVNELASEAFGNHWLNLPADIAANCQVDNPNVEWTDEDLQYIAEGKTPVGSLTYDNVHPTPEGANSQMMAFYRKGVALGYWS